MSDVKLWVELEKFTQVKKRNPSLSLDTFYILNRTTNALMSLLI